MADVGTLPRTCAPPRRDRHGLRHVLGTAAWMRLPAAVRERFAESAADVTYAGAFEVVRASFLGRLFARLGTLFGTPVVPRGGANVAARVSVRETAAGVAWIREYLWHDGTRHVVSSTKVIDGQALIEKLPARLNMPLHVFEERGVLVFESRGYYFDLRVGDFGVRVPLPELLSPGTTRVEHVDLGHGWFRFTMIVWHPWFGEMFFQTGRFCAAEENS
jgi:hypothetical protein